MDGACLVMHYLGPYCFSSFCVFGRLENVVTLMSFSVRSEKAISDVENVLRLNNFQLEENINLKNVEKSQNTPKPLKHC